MDRLKNHVNKLFNGYEENQQVGELKEEILSNLAAKVADLESEGVEHKEAVTFAIQSIERVDHLLDDEIEVFANKFKVELVQLALLYSIIAWILTMPAIIMGMGVLINYSLLAVVFALGMIFLVLNGRKETSFINKVSLYNIKSIQRYRKTAWRIWWLFIGIVILSITAVHFGSNLWFWRPVAIDGPYQHADLAITYLLPFVSLIIPMLFSKSVALIQKNRAGDTVEY
jgi:hypothetical protein